MKNRADRILLAVFICSTVLQFFLYGILQTIPWTTTWPPSALVQLFYVFPAVPAFCLQLLLCRTVRRWIAAVPTAILVGVVLFSAFGLLTTTGWDNLGFAVFLALSAAPTAGSVLAWAVYGIDRLRKRRDHRG